MIADETIYVTDRASSLESIAKSLQALLPLRRRSLGVHRMTYYDTFDHRVAACGARLLAVQDDVQSKLVWQPGGGRACELRLSAPIAFAWDLTDGQLRDELERVIDGRRLFPEVELEGDGTVLDCLDQRGKTVARIWLEAARVRALDATEWRSLPPFLRVLPVHGYQDELRSLLSIVDSRPGLRRVSEDLRELALRAAGKGGEVVPPVRVDADVDASTGARSLLHALLQVMVANEPGARTDLDSEFLHDFRVAVRRTRTLLTQFKSVFPAPVVKHYRGEFSWLGKATGPTRDLDVLLLRLRYEELDVSLADRQALHEFVAGRQRREHATLVEQFDSPRYRELIEGWRRFVLEPPESDNPEDSTRARFLDVITERVGRLYRRMLQRGRAIDGRSPPEDMHKLRLDAKKLRYLFDGAGLLLPATVFGRVTGALGKLHTLLGKVNDAGLQQACFLKLAREMAGAGTAAPGVMMALGQLAERSGVQGARQRRRFKRRFASFASKRTRREVRLLCSRGSAQ